jgi:hypothetical protein
MTDPTKPKLYRDFIDEVVNMCHEGQGQIRATRVRAGVWNSNASARKFPEQHRINLLLARLAQEDRETIATMLSGAVEQGVFETLKALENFEIAPFQDGYEGSPYNDFIGRLSNEWDWPEPQPRRVPRPVTKSKPAKRPMPKPKRRRSRP